MSKKTIMLSLPRLLRRALAAGFIGLGFVVFCMENRPLPAFQLRDLKGKPVPSAALTNAAQWLLIYAKPSDPRCEPLWNLLEQEGANHDPRQGVLVFSDNGPRVMLLLAKHPGLSKYPRYLDSDNKGGAALGLQGAPVLIGIKAGKIAWSYSGLPSDPQAISLLVLPWINNPATVSASASRIALRPR